jgi:hypothetical protein
VRICSFVQARKGRGAREKMDGFQQLGEDTSARNIHSRLAYSPRRAKPAVRPPSCPKNEEFGQGQGLPPLALDDTDCFNTAYFCRLSLLIHLL